MDSIFLKIILFMSAMVGSNIQPQSDIWIIQENWSHNGEVSQFSAVLDKKYTEKCTFGKSLELPMIIHGAHEIYADGVLIQRFGDPTFKKASSFYLKPAVDCEKISGRQITWKAYSYSQYFARFKNYPQITARSPQLVKLLHEIINITSGFSLVVLCLITSIIFYRKVDTRLFIANFSANLGFATYFIFSGSEYFAFRLSMLSAHRIADIGIWIGVISFMYILLQMKSLTLRTYRVVLAVSILASVIVSIATSGDTIQFGTTLPFPFVIYALTEAFVMCFTKKNESLSAKILNTLSVFIFYAAGLYEIGLVLGIFDANPVLAIGIIGALSAIALAVQAGISHTYKQRDELSVSIIKKNQELVTTLQEKEYILKRYEEISEELKSWVHPFVLKATEENIQFPIRKDISLLVVDIIESSKLHFLSNERGTDFRAHVLKIAWEVVLKYGGEIESQEGDKVYANFGLLGNDENLAQTALSAANEFRAKLKKFNEDHSVDINTGVAIHFAKSCQVNLRESNLNTGIELVKRKKFDTSSIDVDLCHRLETIAHKALPGTNIIASEELIQCLSAQPARCEFIGSYLFKGQPQETGVYVIQSYLAKPEHIAHFQALMAKNYNAIGFLSGNG